MNARLGYREDRKGMKEDFIIDMRICQCREMTRWLREEKLNGIEIGTILICIDAKNVSLEGRESVKHQTVHSCTETSFKHKITCSFQEEERKSNLSNTD